MSFGEKLCDLRKKAGLSQEEAAERLGVSRQTVSQWEREQTTPDINKAKDISRLYNVSYAYLMSPAGCVEDSASIESAVDEIDWTAAWSKKYPILASYPKMDGIARYSQRISEMYDDFKDEYKCSDQDAVLILKDILYQKFKEAEKQNTKR